jgi:hypothetical protein
MTRRAAGCAVLLAAFAGAVLPGTALAVPKLIRVCASGCDFTTVNDATTDPGTNAGDSIQVEPGTYTEQVAIPKPVNIFGDSSGPRPVITFAPSYGDATLNLGYGASGTSISHLDIRASGYATALVAPVVMTASDLALSSPGGFGVLMQAGNLTDSTVVGESALVLYGGTLRRVTLNGGTNGLTTYPNPTSQVVSDSVVTSSGAGGNAVLAKSSSLSTFAPLKLRNVTAVAIGAGSNGLKAEDLQGSGSPGRIDARNVIARGAATDATADIPPGLPQGGCIPGPDCAPGAVTLGYSNFVTVGYVEASSVGHNQSSDPLFVNPLVGPSQDFHVCSGSPVTGAGVADADNGSSDRDGVSHPDPPSIGAYESAVSCGGGGSGPAAGAPGASPVPNGSAKCKRRKRHRAVAAKRMCRRKRKG